LKRGAAGTAHFEPGGVSFPDSGSPVEITDATANGFEVAPAGYVDFVIVDLYLGLTECAEPRICLLEADLPLMRSPAPGDTLNLVEVDLSDIEPHLSAYLAASAALMSGRILGRAGMGTTA